MFVTAIFNRLRTAARRFAGADQGNIAVIFALASVPVVTFVGAAIDYSRVNAARSSMQAALDSTALMLSKDLTNGTISTSDIEARAKTYFASLYTDKSGTVSASDVHASYTPKDSSGIATIQVNASGTLPTDFLKMAGLPTLKFGTSSTAAWGNSRMRVAMVLDNTGSMDQNNKMAAMQKAAKDMIDTLSTYNNAAGDVYISIVPFAKDVNFGTASDGSSNVNASWINWTEWEAEPRILTDKNYPINVTYNNITYTWADIGPGAPCPFDTSGSSRPTNNSTVRTYGFVCMDRPATITGSPSPTDLSKLSTNKYLIPSSGTYAGMICPGLDSGANYPGKSRIFYNGCYTSVVDQTIVLTSGWNASCPTGKPNCQCSGNGNNRQCKQTTYKHYWRNHPTDSAQAAAAAPGHGTWTGCINDRDQAYDTTNVDPGSSTGGTPSKQFYAEQWADCLPSTVTAMSNQWQTLKDQITAMKASGNTNQAVGLAWGWQSLSTTNGPVKAPQKETGYIYKDYIVLLSDGLNTQNRWSTSQSAIDARQKILCQNIQADKDNPVTVFTIQVNINNGDPQSQVLKDCATNGSFQMITNSDQTSDAFKNILTQISKLRVAR
ncbi:pilus assembly protein [Bradyrhizobium sp. BRP22]|uniref:TadE/TadG family type IV pilus assembly protein n=1 Tax=Bradyrhizobium sp. BRP22 TaxID=2793821 RepID=UPI001CD1A999|nr:TadE/TadG family type IV pilus assembly protein [Bradyrhizobium sp. BRP22]MCA1453502.1 pilus assembly protein [Bradyrhizobium sp. BRP22]